MKEKLKIILILILFMNITYLLESQNNKLVIFKTGGTTSAVPLDVIDSLKFKMTSSVGNTTTSPLTLKVNPNPFSNSTEVIYELADDCEIELTLYNISGMKLQNLASGKQTKGTHKLTLKSESESLSSGSYNLILTSCGKSITEKVVVVR